MLHKYSVIVALFPFSGFADYSGKVCLVCPNVPVLPQRSLLFLFSVCSPCATFPHPSRMLGTLGFPWINPHETKENIHLSPTSISRTLFRFFSFSGTSVSLSKSRDTDPLIQSRSLENLTTRVAALLQTCLEHTAQLSNSDSMMITDLVIVTMVTDIVNCGCSEKDCFQKKSCGCSRHVTEEVLW
jgi:hypothetical protein